MPLSLKKQMDPLSICFELLIANVSNVNLIKKTSYPKHDSIRNFQFFL